MCPHAPDPAPGDVGLLPGSPRPCEVSVSHRLGTPRRPAQRHWPHSRQDAQKGLSEGQQRCHVCSQRGGRAPMCLSPPVLTPPHMVVITDVTTSDPAVLRVFSHTSPSIYHVRHAPCHRNKGGHGARGQTCCPRPCVGTDPVPLRALAVATGPRSLHLSPEQHPVPTCVLGGDVRTPGTHASGFSGLSACPAPGVLVTPGSRTEGPAAKPTRDASGPSGQRATGTRA